MTHATLLTIAGGALLTCALASLVFGSGSGEDKRLREERKLLRALEAQRRSRDARRLREERRHPAAAAAPIPVEVEPVEEQGSEDVDVEAERRAAERQRKREEKEHAAARKAEEAERRTAERLRKRREKEEAAARKAAEREAEKRPTAPEVTVDDDAGVEKPLAELPLYSWANRIETEDSDKV